MVIFASSNRAQLQSSSGVCWSPPGDGYSNVLIGAFRRPISEDATIYPVTHPWTVRWRSYAGAGGKGFNFGAAQFGVDLFEWSASDPLYTITKSGSGADSNNLLVAGPMSFRLSSDIVFNPTAGRDSNVDIYRRDEAPEAGGTWYSFAQLRKTSSTTATAVSCYRFHSFTAKGWGSPTTSSTAARIAKPGTCLRWEEVFGVGGKVEHAIHIAVGAVESDPAHILGTGMRWPAAGRDNSWKSNAGIIDYGAWLWLPPESRDGPDLASLGLTEAQMRIALGLRNHGMVISDKGNLVAKGRCAQNFSVAERSNMNGAMAKVWDHMRFIDGASDSTTYIGGNSKPMTHYCGAA